MTKILGIVIDESMEEMADMDSRVLGSYLHTMACMMEWVATGDMTILPPDLIPFACKVEGIDIPQPDTEDSSEIVDAEIVG